MAPMAASAVDNARRLIDQRLAEISEESERLNGALRELAGSKAVKRGRPGKIDGTPRERKPASPKGKAQRAGRGERREQLLAAVKKNPGSTGAELAKAIGIRSNQIYGLLGKVQADGAIVKDGKGYRLA